MGLERTEHWVNKEIRIHGENLPAAEGSYFACKHYLLWKRPHRGKLDNGEEGPLNQQFKEPIS